MTVITMMASEPRDFQAMKVAVRLGDCPGLVESMMVSLCFSHEVTVSQLHPSLVVFEMANEMTKRRWHPEPKMLARRRQCQWSWDCYCGKNISGWFLVYLCVTYNRFWPSGRYVFTFSGMFDALERGNEEKSEKWTLLLWGITIDESECFYRSVHV